MSGFKAMKFRAVSPAHSERIQKVLFKLGYRWETARDRVTLTDAEYLYTSTPSDGHITYGTTESYFKDHRGEEYILIPSYMDVDTIGKKPEPVVITSNNTSGITITGGFSNGTLIAVAAPVGLTPKYIKDALRTQEILEAMLRFSKAGKPIPFAWQTELWELLGKKTEEEEKK